MQQAPKGLRTHIAIIGRRNAGKSSLINAIARQSVSIVSSMPGTTTDPVEKTMELYPIGPAVLVDTAGMDDEGSLGKKRIERSMEILKRADLAVIVTCGSKWDQNEKDAVKSLQMANVPFVIARNKSDLEVFEPCGSWLNKTGLDINVPVIDISAQKKQGIEELVLALDKIRQKDEDKPLLHDLLPENGIAVFVVPIDKGAPKGRLILPQVQSLRDVLDDGKTAMLCTECQFDNTLAKLKTRPDLVVCDSQVVQTVAGKTPLNIPMTTFSILMARFKGNLIKFAEGAASLRNLNKNDTVVIQEACSHHPVEDDIAHVKLPVLLKKISGGEINIIYAEGKEMFKYPENTRLIIHCGGCVITSAQMKKRQFEAASAKIPMTNYGMAISYAQGVLERVLKPFPQALKQYMSI